MRGQNYFVSDQPTDERIHGAFGSLPFSQCVIGEVKNACCIWLGFGNVRPCAHCQAQIFLKKIQ